MTLAVVEGKLCKLDSHILGHLLAVHVHLQLKFSRCWWFRAARNAVGSVVVVGNGCRECGIFRRACRTACCDNVTSSVQLVTMAILCLKSDDHLTAKCRCPSHTSVNLTVLGGRLAWDHLADALLRLASQILAGDCPEHKTGMALGFFLDVQSGQAGCTSFQSKEEGELSFFLNLQVCDSLLKTNRVSCGIEVGFKLVALPVEHLAAVVSHIGHFLLHLLNMSLDHLHNLTASLANLAKYFVRAPDQLGRHAIHRA